MTSCDVRLVGPSDNVIDPLVDALGYDDDDDDDDEFILREEQDLPKLNCYVLVVGRYPWIVILCVILVIGTMAGLSWKYHPPSDINFNDPTEGFNTRNTPISAAESTHHKLLGAIGHKLTVIPNISTISLFQKFQKDTSKSNFNTPKHTVETIRLRIEREAGKELSCQSAFKYGYNLIFASTSGDNLFNVNSLRAMCKIEDQYIVSEFPPKCRRESLASNVAEVFGKACLNITSNDVLQIKKVLYRFSNCNSTKYYLNIPCPLEEIQCYSSIRNMLTKYADLNFQKTCRDGNCFLKYAKMDLEDEANWKFFLKVLEGRNIELNGVTLIAVNMQHNGVNEKYGLFEYYLIYDVRFFILAMALVLLVMLGYLKSVALMLATVLNVGFSYTAAYFFYYFVFRQTFFPFMNFLALLVLIAVGADDVFIFYDAWLHAKKELPNGTYANWIGKTFKHATVSVIVTSFTTAGAFLSNMISSITTIKCFGLFAGICILTNLLLMLTWTPSVIVIVEKVWDWLLRRLPRLSSVWNAMIGHCSKASSSLYDKYIPLAIEKGRFFWVVILFMIGAAGIVIIFYKPGLQLPNTSDFQLFSDDMKMEKWDRELEFQFPQKAPEKVIATFSWGVKCKDNRNLMDPTDEGYLEYDNMFDLFSESSQIAMEKFINNSRKYPYFAKWNIKKPSMWEVIFLERKLMCNESSTTQFALMCCKNISKFPFPNCIKEIMAKNPSILLGSLTHPAFNRKGQAKALIFQTETTLPLSFSYEKMNENYQQLHKFYEEQKRYMPKEMNSMCFSGQGWQFSAFYDLQLAIANGTLWSIGFSLAIASVILFLSSLNLILTIYSIVTITLAIAVTIGAIVLMGWDLNILESIAVSMAAGLSVDFTIHYSVAYRLSEEVTPKLRVREGFRRVGFAVGVAALTTFLAGAAVMPSHVIAYTKLGIFLMLVMSFSWIYATFFFQSLCCIIGPKGNFCQLQSPTRLCKKKKNRRFAGYEQSNPAIYNNDDNDDTLLQPI